MAYKEREFICKVCENKFNSCQPNPVTCSKSCKMKLMGKQLKSEKKTIGECEWCHKNFEYIPDNRNPIHRFDTQECRHSYRGQYVKEHGNSEEAKKKISKSLIGRSLINRGFDKESIKSSIAALKIAGKEWNNSIKGKTYENIHGEEKAKEIKQKFSEDRSGINNSQSLENISKRIGCSLEEAVKYTTCYGRSKEKHPMFNKHQSIETKIKIVRAIELSGIASYKVATGTFNNIVWQGSWELQFLIECYDRNITVKRYDWEPLEYIGSSNKIRHYFPDYIINDTYVIEIKNPMLLKESNVKRKIEIAEKTFKSNYVVISAGFENKTTRKRWYKVMQEKYGDLLVIKHNPHEVKNDSKG